MGQLEADGPCTVSLVPSEKSTLSDGMSYSRTDTYFRLHILIYIQFLSRRRQWQPTPVLLLGNSHGRRSLVGCSLWGREESDTTERLPFHALEKEMTTHSSVLAWRIPGKEEPGGLLSMGSHRVGHD